MDMSQPPYMYSPYPGQQNQQASQYVSSTPVQVPGLYYPTPQQMSTVAAPSNIAATNASYEYNGSRIPGLGMAGDITAPTFPGHSMGGERGASWYLDTQGGHQNTVPLRTNQEQSVSRASERQGSFATARAKFNAAQPPMARAEVLEEGELSESQFEDLYEPRAPHQIPEERSRQAPEPSSVPAERSGSAGDADGSSIYDTGSTQEEAIVDSTSVSLPAAEDDAYSPRDLREPAHPARERSGSYSPYLSPREIQEQPSVSKINSRDAKHIASYQESLQPFADSGRNARQRPDSAGANDAVASGKTQPAQVNIQPNFSQSTPAPGLRYKSVSEAKKKAQEAILGLLPLKVRYQDYIDEGFDPELIKGLFIDLGLDTSPPKPTASLPKPSAATKSLQSPHATSNSKSNSKSLQPTASVPAATKLSAASQPVVIEMAHHGPVQSDSKADSRTDEKAAGEERHQKIARMLAMKKQKAAVTVAPTPPVASFLASAPKAPTLAGSQDHLKDKLRTETSLKVKEKLAKLRKVQEKKKQAVDKETVSTVTSNAPEKTAEVAVTTASASGPDQESSSGERDNTPSTSIIPGLHPSFTPQPTSKPRQLKRPVASDFDNCSSNGSTLKRKRTQDTLIIDVSDDEDVEMDIGSPTDAPTSAVQSNNASGRPNTLGAFPPLTNTNTWRQHSSPAQTPPVHGIKLDFLHKQIEEAKRKIAEAEAKKAAKRSNGTTTPVEQTPVESEPKQLSTVPVIAKLANGVQQEQQEVLASHEMPQVDSAIKDKQDRLRRLKEEAAQLELEIQASLAVRQKSTVEIEGHEGSAPAESNAVTPGPVSTLLSVQSESTTLPRAAAPAGETGPHFQSGPTSAKQESEVREFDSSGDKTDMDIDTPDSSGEVNGGQLNDDRNRASSVVISSTGEGVTTPFDIAKDVPNGTGAPISLDTSACHSDTVDAVVNGTHAAAEVHTQHILVDDADTSMQMSAGELSGDDDHYKPMPTAISSTDKVHDSGSEDGQVFLHQHRMHEALLTGQQIADEYSLEAQAPEAPGRPREEAPTGEVQPRPFSGHPLLTNLQAKPSPAFSAKELLSYESPLKYFHAYRFHPKFFDDVAGGLKSMTYSSRIDPMRPLCPSNLAGDACPNGATCELQHFERMVLPDTDLIAQLGSTDMYTGEQKSHFVDGLKKVLNDLKTNRVKDFDRITRAIIQYRADFFGDKSKVLPLDVKI